MLAKPGSGQRQILPLEKVEENRGNVRWLTVFVHGPDFPSEKEFYPCRKAINIGRSKHRHAARYEQLNYVSQEAYWILDLLDHLYCGDEMELDLADLGGEIRLIEIDTAVRNIGLETSGVAVNGKHLASQGLEPQGHCSRPRPKIHCTRTSVRVL